MARLDDERLLAEAKKLEKNFVTDIEKRIEILGEFYFAYRDEMSLRKFIEFNDLGFPLAYLASEGLCALSEEGKKYVDQTWELLLEALNIGEQKFEDIDELINLAMYENEDVLKAINKFMSSHKRNWKKKI